MAVLKMNFYARYLAMQTNITVILPTFGSGPRSDDNAPFYRPGMQFQTLYLLHGGSGDDADYVNFTSIVRYAYDHQIAVVMPADYNAFYTDNPKGPRYFKYIADELPLMCQSLFPLSPRREDNFVAGLSMGGYGAMKLAVMRCEQYAAALCMSGAVIDPDKMKAFQAGFRRRHKARDDTPRMDMRTIFGNLDKFKGSENDAWHHARLAVAAGKRLPKFFFTVGDKDFALEGVEDAYHYLSGLGCDAIYDLVPGYGHEWDFWDLTLRKALAEWLPIRHSVIYPE